MDRFSEYKKSFFFGVKFVVLVLILLLPIIVFSFIGIGIYQAISKLPLFYIEELEIEKIYSFGNEFKLNELARNRIEINEQILKLENKDGSFYVKINRKPDNEVEIEEAKNKVNNILSNQEYEYKVFDVDQNGLTEDTPVTKAYLWTPKYSWNGTVIYGGLTALGSTLIVIVGLSLFIIGAATYFPIFRAFVNLFKYKKIL